MNTADIEAFLASRKKAEKLKKEFGGYDPDKVNLGQLLCIANKDTKYTADAVRSLVDSGVDNLDNSTINTILSNALKDLQLKKPKEASKDFKDYGVKQVELDIGSLGAGTSKEKFNAKSTRNHVDFLLRVKDGEIKYLYEDLGDISLENLSWNSFGFYDYGVKPVRYVGWDKKKDKEFKGNVLNDIGINTVEVVLPMSSDFIIPTKRGNSSISVQFASTRDGGYNYDGVLNGYMTVPQLMSAFVLALRTLGYSKYLDIIFKEIFENNRLTDDELLGQFKTRFTIANTPYRDASSIYKFRSGSSWKYVYAKYSDDYSTDKSFLKEFYQFIFNNICKLAKITKKSFSEKLNEQIIVHGAWDREHQGDVDRCPTR